MSHLEDRLAQLLDKRRAQGRFRQLRQYDTAASQLVDMSSNDYLSLTTSPALRTSYITLLQSSSQPILGSTGSRLLSGATSAHAALECRLADLFDAPSCLLFNSGWDANVSFFSTVPQQGDWIVYDELVHASVHDGMRAARLGPQRRVPFRHNDPKGLEDVLRRIDSAPSSSSSQGGTVFVALESLYSMDGDFARLAELLDVLDRHVPRERQCVVIDEAHTTGTFGRQGRGLAHLLREHQSGDGREAGKQKGRVTVRLITFGKGVGCSGAALLLPPIMRSFLINFARPLIFSTALPHSTLLALHAAWDHLVSPAGDAARSRLHSLSSHLHARLGPLLQPERCPRGILHLPDELSPASSAAVRTGTGGTIVGLGPSQILGLVTPRPHELSAWLLGRGFIVRPVVPPTVPPGGERIRICLRSEMTEETLDRLVEALQDWIDKEKTREAETRAAFRRGEEVQLRAKL